MYTKRTVAVTADAYEKILAVFSDYLNQKVDLEFVRSEKWGWLYISLCGTYKNTSYNVIRIVSVEHLFEILMELFTYHYLAAKGMLCINGDDVQTFYNEWIAPYMEQLPEYRPILHSAFIKVLSTVRCTTDSV